MFVEVGDASFAVVTGEDRRRRQVEACRYYGRDNCI